MNFVIRVYSFMYCPMQKKKDKLKPECVHQTVTLAMKLLKSLSRMRIFLKNWFLYLFVLSNSMVPYFYLNGIMTAPSPKLQDYLTWNLEIGPWKMVITVG